MQPWSGRTRKFYKPNSHYKIEVTRMHDPDKFLGADHFGCCLRSPGRWAEHLLNVANLILARAVRREPKMAIRAALGATTAAFRRSLLAEDLCSAAVARCWSFPLQLRWCQCSRPLCTSRFSVRALDLSLDFKPDLDGCRAGADPLPFSLPLCPSSLRPILPA